MSKRWFFRIMLILIILLCVILLFKVYESNLKNNELTELLKEREDRTEILLDSVAECNTMIEKSNTHIDNLEADNTLTLQEESLNDYEFIYSTYNTSEHSFILNNPIDTKMELEFKELDNSSYMEIADKYYEYYEVWIDELEATLVHLGMNDSIKCNDIVKLGEVMSALTNELYESGSAGVWIYIETNKALYELARERTLLLKEIGDLMGKGVEFNYK